MSDIKELKALIMADAPAMKDQTVIDVDNLIAEGTNVQALYRPDFIDRLALLPIALWGGCRVKLLAKFGSGLGVRTLDRAVAEARVRLQQPSQPRNGAAPDEGAWQSRLLRSDEGKMLHCLENVALFLEHHSAWRDVLAYNELTAGYEIKSAPPEPVTVPVDAEIDDHFDTEATRWLERKGVHVKIDSVRKVVDAIARVNAYHPVRDYLNALPAWDGTPRIGSWLVDYCGVETSDANPNFYAEAVGAKFLISAVARVFEPGCKADHILILEGEQGIGKSTAARILAGDKWFTDQIAELGSKDASMQLRGVWIVELPELHVLGRAEMEKAKAFFSAQAERFRTPYGKRVVQVPRQCVFIGTTNSDTWLKDETGGRRFWPVKCHAFDLTGLAHDRDQLWAEALLRYRQGVHWWLEGLDLIAEARQQQGARYINDPWQEDVMLAAGEAAAHSAGHVSVRDVLAKMGIDTARRDQAAATRVGRCLKVAGWDRFRHRWDDGAREWRYRRG